MHRPKVGKVAEMAPKQGGKVTKTALKRVGKVAEIPLKQGGKVTKEHLEAIEKYGIFDEYRKTYKPVKKIIDKGIFRN